MQNKDEKVVIDRNCWDALIDSRSYYAFPIYIYMLNKGSNNNTRTVVIPYAELEEFFNIGRSTVGRNIRILKDCGLIKRGHNTSEFELCDTVHICNYNKVL